MELRDEAKQSHVEAEVFERAQRLVFGTEVAASFGGWVLDCQSPQSLEMEVNVLCL
jgi:hypothetical protein